MPEKTIVTARLILRPFNLDLDATSLHEILGEPAVLRYFPNQSPPSQQRVRELIQYQIDHWRRHRYGWWALVPRASGDLAGWCGLQYLPETEETEVAYLLSTSSWGQGLATEAAEASLAFAFDTLGLSCVVGIIHPDNVASQQVLRKLGMKCTGPDRYFDMDCLRYEITRATSQWRSGFPECADPKYDR